MNMIVDGHVLRVSSMDGEAPSQETGPGPEIDPIWTSSRTASQIYDLGEVEKDIGRLLSLAASSIALLSLPQTDEPDDTLPKGEERSEQFVLEVREYFERLDSIQMAIRSSLAHIRQSRIAPSALNAPPPNFVPSSLGVGLPGASGTPKTRGLQEERVERDAWRGVLDALTRLRDAQAEAEGEKTPVPMRTEGIWIQHGYSQECIHGQGRT
ncbi:hypothetical protein FA95DRAFT_1341767 [Auriscalpium vulgare]|uniref:Uncharacterized protein n=1 Tax=Auriscalpium vulgare TaxID=40419 RepID=A0ACB8RT58_9AGAM|nr:hypothetical protein FA95DRAFT_1341767 [Auriscalpium vulgare]